MKEKRMSLLISFYGTAILSEITENEYMSLLLTFLCIVISVTYVYLTKKITKL